MASITKRGNKWRARASYVDAKGERQQPSKTFDTKREATEWAAKLETQIIDGADINAAKMKFSEYYRTWVATYKEPTVRASTLVKYHSFANELDKLIGDVQLDKLTALYLQNKINEFGESHTKAYFNNIVSTIKASLKDAQIDGIIKKDIYSRLKANGGASKDDDNYLSASDFEKLQSWLYDHTDLMIEDKFYFAVLIALETGARVGEILALTVDDFNFSNNTMTINKAYSKATASNTETKTRSGNRTIDVTDNLLALVNELEEGGVLFPKKWFRDVFSERMKQLAEEVGFPAIRFHGLRHSHVSYLLHNGVDIAYISKRVGHSNVNVTLKTYAHMLKEKEAEQSSRTINLLQKNAVHKLR